MIMPDPQIRREIEEQRPPFAVGLLRRGERDRLIERGVAGLYRWYVARSQATRNWNPDQSFDWRLLRTDHSQTLMTVLEGFFAVEYYVPDYTSRTIAITRRSEGRSHFQIRWGAEEAKHADLWQNAILFARHRSPAWLAQYKHDLRGQEWQLPWEDGFHMVLYALIQERATQVNYLHMAEIARGRSAKLDFAQAADPVLAKVAQTIAIDEAAHYNFFLEATRLHLYYYPTETLAALWDVIEHFAMPGMELIPDRPRLEEILHQGAIYGPREYSRDVLRIVFEHLRIRNRRALEAGVRQSRVVPDADGTLRSSAIFATLDYAAIMAAVERLVGRINEYESEVGIAAIDPLLFVPSGWEPPTA